MATIVLRAIMNDDDEEIRDIGAAITSSQVESMLIPPAALKRVTAWLIEHCQTSETLLCHAAHLATGSTLLLDDKNHQSNFVVVSDSLCEMLRDDDTLFVEEEQNLYIDDAEEARVWNHVLRECLVAQRRSSTTSKLLLALSTWVLQGLKALSSLASVGGPLDWKIKPPVFVCCLRVISCAKALLAVLDHDGLSEGQNGEHGPREESVTLSDFELSAKSIKASLDQFARKAAEFNVHALLLKELIGSELFMLVAGQPKKSI